MEQNAYAVVAGGSKGIGYAIADALGRRHFNLVLIARGMDSLVAAKTKLESTYGVHVELIRMDLTDQHAADSIASFCISKNLAVRMLCNVAGFGGERDFLSLHPDTLRYMIHINLESVVALTYSLLPLLEKNAPSYIMNVASMAAFAPIPSKNLYASTKSAVLYFSYALSYQLREKQISVSCLAPGPVFSKQEVVNTTVEKLGWFGMRMALMPYEVGEIAVKRTLHGQMIIVPGTLAKLTSYVIRVLPRAWTAGIYGMLD